MKILVCVDGSPQSMKAVVKAVEIASGCQINEVTLINVFEKYPFPIFKDDGGHQIEDEMKEHKLLNEQMVNQNKKYLEHAAMRFREKGIEPDLIMKEGHPAHTISEAAKGGSFDMIIMGSRGRGNLRSLLLGSVSNAVIQQTNASVLVVK